MTGSLELIRNHKQTQASSFLTNKAGVLIFNKVIFRTDEKFKPKSFSKNINYQIRAEFKLSIIRDSTRKLILLTIDPLFAPKTVIAGAYKWKLGKNLSSPMWNKVLMLNKNGSWRIPFGLWYSADNEIHATEQRSLPVTPLERWDWLHRQTNWREINICE